MQFHPWIRSSIEETEFLNWKLDFISFLSSYNMIDLQQANSQALSLIRTSNLSKSIFLPIFTLLHFLSIMYFNTTDLL